MMTATLLLLSILAAYRLTRFLVLDDGPGQIFVRVRSLPWPAWIGDGLGCVHCAGAWMAAAAAAIAAPSFALYPVWWLAIAGGVSVLANLEKYE